MRFYTSFVLLTDFGDLIVVSPELCIIVESKLVVLEYELNATAAEDKHGQISLA